MLHLIKKIFNIGLTYYKDIVVLAIVITVLWVLLYRVISPPVTMLMVQRWFSEEGDLHFAYVSQNTMSPYVKVCAIASEDQNFPFHSGLDLEAIEKAMHLNKKGRKVYGASTISQQVAKNVFLFPQRTYIRKVLELYFTLWMETLWPKEKILEMYLNVAEMGNLIFGVEAAAQEYFHKPSSQLTLNESAAIIAILPNPRKYKAVNPGKYVADRQEDISSLYYSLDGKQYLRELYIKTENSLYDFSNYKK